MTAATRDPRMDPEVGDSIAREFKTAVGGCIIREVTRAHGGFVFFQRDNGHVAKSQIVSIGQWRKWARTAEVLEIA